MKIWKSTRGFENLCKILYLSNIRIFFKKWHNEVEEWYWCCWILYCKLKHQLGSQQRVKPFCCICALVGCQCQPSPFAAMSFTRTCSISQIFENCNKYIWMCIISKCYMLWSCCQGKYDRFNSHRTSILCSSEELQLEAADIVLQSCCLPTLFQSGTVFSTLTSLHQHKWFWRNYSHTRPPAQSGCLHGKWCSIPVSVSW